MRLLATGYIRDVMSYRLSCTRGPSHIPEWSLGVMVMFLLAASARSPMRDVSIGLLPVPQHAHVLSRS
jgi:hypothetical protein